MEKICVIFAGGPEEGLPCLPVPEGAFVICADSGLHLAEKLMQKPDLVLGDFDSLGAVPEQLPHLTVPVEKDDTDTMLAVRVALEKGFRDVRIYGAFGGRLDHTLANVQTLEFLHNAGAEGLLVGVRDFAQMLSPGAVRRYERRDGWSLSLFSWSAECTGVTVQGTQYLLEKGILTRGFPLGVSNRITAKTAEISCEHGLLLAVCSRL